MKAAVVACLLLGACAPSAGSPSPASPSLPVEWSAHEAAGLRITAPTAWGAPQVLPAADARGAPAGPFVVFHDPAGAEALTLLLWRDASSTVIASAQFDSELPQGDRQELTLRDGGRTRAAIAVTAYAQWHDANGGGTYECRHVFVQVDQKLAVDVIACGAHVKGTATPTPELRGIQDRVAARLGITGGAP